MAAARYRCLTAMLLAIAAAAAAADDDRVTSLPGLDAASFARLPPMYAGALPAAAAAETADASGAPAPLAGSLFYWLCESETADKPARACRR